MTSSSKLYEFRQNNSGGDFTFDEKAGISHFVYVEATSADEANRKAEQIGLYFDGEGDCPCCGDRWCEASEYDAEENPALTRSDYAAQYGGIMRPYWWMGDDPEGFVHYADGRIVAVLEAES